MRCWGDRSGCRVAACHAAPRLEMLSSLAPANAAHALHAATTVLAVRCAALLGIACMQADAPCTLSGNSSREQGTACDDAQCQQEATSTWLRSL